MFSSELAPLEHPLIGLSYLNVHVSLIYKKTICQLCMVFIMNISLKKSESRQIVYQGLKLPTIFYCQRLHLHLNIVHAANQSNIYIYIIKHRGTSSCLDSIFWCKISCPSIFSWVKSILSCHAYPNQCWYLPPTKTYRKNTPPPQLKSWFHLAKIVCSPLFTHLNSSIYSRNTPQKLPSFIPTETCLSYIIKLS